MIATGARPGLPAIRGLLDSPAVDAFDVIRRPAGRHRRALVIGVGLLGVAVAHVLAERAVDVTVAEPGAELVAELGLRPRWQYVADLRARENVTVRLGASVETIDGDRAVLRCQGEELTVSNLDLVVPTGLMVPASDLGETLQVEGETGLYFLRGRPLSVRHCAILRRRSVVGRVLAAGQDRPDQERCRPPRAYDDDLARLTVNAPLNAVEFFRSREFIEVGPGSIGLEDGTCLPAVKMEHLVSQPLVFAGDQSLADRVISSLACDGAGSRAKALRALKAQSPQEALDAIVSLLNHPEEKIRRRAGGALTLFSKLHGEPVNVEQKADALAHYLEHGEDPRVRLSCALALGPVHSPNADRAFLRALADPFDKVVQWACREVGERCGGEGTGAIKGLLNHSSWHVRLIACITLVKPTSYQRGGGPTGCSLPTSAAGLRVPMMSPACSAGPGRWRCRVRVITP